MSKVYLVGAGPGDPGLLTIKALECIRKADVIVYDRLVHPTILRHAPIDAEMIYVGKASSRHTLRQEEINRLLVEKSKQGKTVVRLKGGDPFVFGRGGEEAEALAADGIEFEVIPGVTSAIAVPAYAGIPVTHRGFCSAMGIITGHEDPVKTVSSIKWDKISTGLDTLVFLMGVENLPNIVSELIANGRDSSTPIALVRWGTLAKQETLTGTLADIVDKVKKRGFESPAVTVVGDVVRLRERLRWFDNRPLSGLRVLVTRSREQASALSEALREYGAEPVEFPVLKIAPPDSFAKLDDALERIEEYDWLLFTSANGVTATINRLYEIGRDVRWLKGPKIMTIGSKTADALRAIGIRVDFTPNEFVAEALVREFPESPQGKRILLVRAKEARELIPEKLTERGAEVDVVAAYQTLVEESESAPIKQMLAAGEIDIITFTSSSTVTNFVKLIGKLDGRLGKQPIIACIGPITAKTAEENGLKPDVISETYTIEALVESIVGLVNRR